MAIRVFCIGYEVDMGMVIVFKVVIIVQDVENSFSNVLSHNILVGLVEKSRYHLV